MPRPAPRHVSIALAVAVVGIACSIAPPVRAQTADEVTQAAVLFEHGVALADEERWEEAVEQFRRALEIVERPSILYNMGIALHRLGRGTEARETLTRFLEVAPTSGSFGPQIGDARRLLADIGASVARLTLSIDPPDAMLRVDGRAIPGSGSPRTIELDPGSHVLEVEADGFAPARVPISIPRGATTSRDVRLDALETTAPVTTGGDDLVTSPILWTIVGIFVVGAAVGIPLGVHFGSPQVDGGTNGIVLEGLVASF